MPATPDNQASQASPVQPHTPPVPPYQPTAFPPPKKGPRAVKVILILLGVLVGLGLIGAGILYGVYKAIIVPSDSSPITAADLGVTIYPGAVQAKGGMRMVFAGKSEVTGAYLSPDSKDQVIAFYQSQLGHDAQIKASGDRETLYLFKGPGELVSVTMTQRPNQFEGKTQIVILHAKSATSPTSN